MNTKSLQSNSTPQYSIWHILTLCGLLFACILLPFFSCYEDRSNHLIIFYGYTLQNNPLLLPIFGGSPVIALLSILLSRSRSRRIIIPGLVLGILVAIAGLGSAYITSFTGLHTGFSRMDILGPIYINPTIEGVDWDNSIKALTGQRFAQILWWAILFRQVWHLFTVTGGSLLLQRIFLCSVMISNFFPFYLRSEDGALFGGSRTPNSMVNGFGTFFALPLFWVAVVIFILFLLILKWKKIVISKFYLPGFIISFICCGLIILDYNFLAAFVWIELQYGWAVYLIFWLFICYWFLWHINKKRKERLSQGKMAVDVPGSTPQ